MACLEFSSLLVVETNTDTCGVEVLCDLLILLTPALPLHYCPPPTLTFGCLTRHISPQPPKEAQNKGKSSDQQIIIFNNAIQNGQTTPLQKRGRYPPATAPVLALMLHTTLDQVNKTGTEG